MDIINLAMKAKEVTEMTAFLGTCLQLYTAAGVCIEDAIQEKECPEELKSLLSEVVESIRVNQVVLEKMPEGAGHTPLMIDMLKRHTRLSPTTLDLLGRLVTEYDDGVEVFLKDEKHELLPLDIAKIYIAQMMVFNFTLTDSSREPNYAMYEDLMIDRFGPYTQQVYKKPLTP